MCSLRKSCSIEALSQREQETTLEEDEEGEKEGRRRRNRYPVEGIAEILNQIANSQYCNLRDTYDKRTRREEEKEVEERRNRTVTRSVVFKFEWLLMETLSFIVAKTERISRSHVKWTSYRKLRRCKKLVNCYLVAVYINLLNRIVIRPNNDLSEQHQQERQKSCDRKQVTSNTISDTSHEMKVDGIVSLMDEAMSNSRNRNHQIKRGLSKSKFLLGYFCLLLSSLCLVIELSSSGCFREIPVSSEANLAYLPLFSFVDASLIIGDSAIEIQEVGEPNSQQQNSNSLQQNNNNEANQQRHQDLSHYEEPSLILGSTSGSVGSIDSQLKQAADSLLHSQKPSSSLVEQQQSQNVKHQHRTNSVPAGPLPPIAGSGKQRDDDITDGDKKSRNTHDYEASDLNGENNRLDKVSSSIQPVTFDDKAITGKVVDFELTPAGGHNKAKIKKKKKKKKMMEEKEFKKWGKKKKSEKKAHDKKMKESMKKKKEEGKKKKKKWGIEEHGQKKKGKFKKKKWGKKVKKGKGVKKGKKGKKFLKDKGHKNTGFKNVYHKEEWGKSSKWHDIKREKKWDEKSKKWKKKWKKEKGKKYKGDHMKKFKKEKKSGKKYKKEKNEKFVKSKKEEFKKGKKEKMEEHGKKKEGGAKKEMKEEKKKKKKKKKKG